MEANRDALDFSAFFAMRNNLSSPGTANAWYNVRDSLLDLADDGLHNGSAGVLFVRSHDEYGPTSLGNVAHAMTLMYPGNTVVYFNGKEFGAERDFPKDGRGDALGGLYGETLQKLLAIGNLMDAVISMNAGSTARGFMFLRGIDLRWLACPIEVTVASMSVPCRWRFRREPSWLS